MVVIMASEISIKKTGANNYMRIRIGIGHPGHKKDVTNWVLTKFSPNEKKSCSSI
jgi:PTH1 family peptidyl-tRNA hydrolase